MTEEITIEFRSLHRDLNEAQDSFDFTTEQEAEAIGLLLPAVSAAREASRPASDEASGDSFTFTEGEVQMADGKHKEWIEILSMGGGVSELEIKPPIVTSYSTSTPVTETPEADETPGDFLF